MEYDPFFEKPKYYRYETHTYCFRKIRKMINTRVVPLNLIQW